MKPPAESRTTRVRGTPRERGSLPRLAEEWRRIPQGEPVRRRPAIWAAMGHCQFQSGKTIGLAENGGSNLARYQSSKKRRRVKFLVNKFGTSLSGQLQDEKGA